MRTSGLALWITVAVVAGAAPAGATLLVYEPFDYPEGVLAGAAASGENLTGSYVGGPVPPGFELRAAAPGLDYGALQGAPAASGNRLTQPLGTTSATASVDVDADVVIAPGSAIFFSALFTLDDSQNGNHLASVSFLDEDDELSFGESVVGVRAIRISANTAATGGSLVAAGDDQAFSNGQTLLLLGRYVNGAAPDTDVLQLVGYDTADGDLLPPDFDPADPNAEFSYLLDGVTIDLAQIRSIRFTIRGEANNFIDELRVGSSYADVVPEPGTAALLAAGLVALALRARR